MPYASHSIHFSDDILPAAVDGWFDVMAALHRAAPWSEGPHLPCPVFVTLGGQDILDAVLLPFERDGGRRGFALLQGPDGAPDVERTNEPVTRTVSAGGVDVEIELSTRALAAERAAARAAGTRRRRRLAGRKAARKARKKNR